MYDDLPATRINQQTGIKLCQIYKTLRQESVEIRPRGRRPVLENPGRATLTLMLSDSSQKKVSLELGVSKRTIQSWLKQLETSEIDRV